MGQMTMDGSRTQYRNKVRREASEADSPRPVNRARGRRFVPSVFVLLLITPTVGLCKSQVPAAVNTTVPIPHPITSLLRDRQVRDELGMSTAQIDAAEQVICDADLPLWCLRDVPVQQRNETAAWLIRQLRQGLAQILSPPQVERLDQLAWQAEGIAAVIEPDVASGLDLSGKQNSRIHMLLSTSYVKLATFYKSDASLSESRRSAYVRKLLDEAEKNVLAVLSNSQRRTLGKLMGRPFNLSHVRIIACKAPEIQADAWINLPDGTTLNPAGKVTVVHFYTFGCGNCIRTLPYYNRWREHFSSSVFQIIGIHRPETEQERDIDKVKKRATEADIQYPVAIDNDSRMWNTWANRIWPSMYLIDRNGYVRYWWYGELNWQGAESERVLRDRIQNLIDETP
jgi:thiol-disulfide isomerase/thioredoxin